MNLELSADDGVEELFRLYASDVYRFARYLAPKGVDAKDIVQEVFLRAFKRWNSIQDTSNPKAWLLQITRNYTFDLLRRRRVEASYRERHKPDTSGVTVSLDTLVELEEAISQLKPNFRTVVVLRCIHDLTVRETADILKWSESKVRTTMHRAVRELRVLLGPERFDEPGQLREAGETHEHG